MTVVRRALSGLVGALASLASVVAVSSATGGPLTWAITQGGSMLPAITPGTLTVLQKRPVYRTGDVVGYRNGDLADQVVLHRVIAVGDTTLTLKGDANAWVDPYRPTTDEVLGEQVLAVPMIGAGLSLLDGPLAVAALAGGVTLLVLRRRTGPRRRTSAAVRARRPAPVRAPLPSTPAPTPPAAAAPLPVPRSGSSTPPPTRSWAEPPRPRAGGDTELLVLPAGLRDAAAVGLLCSVLLGAATAVLPTAQTTQADRPAQAGITFEYSARAPRGIVYPDGQVTTGTPVFTRVVDDVVVSADLAVTLPPGAVSSGTWRLVVDVSDESGWKSTAYVGRPVDLTDRRREVHVVPSQLLALAQRASEATGLAPAQRKVTVRALVEATASLGAATAVLRAQPELVFLLDPLTLRLAPDAVLTGGGDAALPAPQQAPAEHLVLGPLRLPADRIRLLAVAGGVTSLLLLALVGAAAQLRDETASVRRRHPGLLVPTGPVPLVGPVVEVDDLAALVRIAGRYERFVLTHEDPAGSVFLVQDDGTTYRYVAPHRKGAALPTLPTLPTQRTAADDVIRVRP